MRCPGVLCTGSPAEFRQPQRLGKLQQTLTQGCPGQAPEVSGCSAASFDQPHGGCSTCLYLLSSRGPGSLMRLGSCLSSLESTHSSSSLSLPFISSHNKGSCLPAGT